MSLTKASCSIKTLINYSFTLWFLSFEGTSQLGIFDKLAINCRQFEIHNSANLFNVILFLFITDVPWVFPVFVQLLSTFRSIWIFKGLLCSLEIEHVTCKKSFDYLLLTQMRIWNIIHNYLKIKNNVRYSYFFEKALASLSSNLLN